MRKCSIITILLLCTLLTLTGCSYQTKSFPEIVQELKMRLSYDESLGRINILGYAENIVAVDCAWEDAEFAENWFPRTPKLADRIAIANRHSGYTLYWREGDEGEDFYQSLNDMALMNGYECISSNPIFFTNDIKREEYTYRLEEVEEPYSGWGNLKIHLTIEWNMTESDMEYNISAHYKTEWNKDTELTQQKKEEQGQ